MDIGDPNEIPATRKKLPSMQELGAFDFGEPPSGSNTPRVSAPVALDSRPAPLAPPAAAGRSTPGRAMGTATVDGPTRPVDLDGAPAPSLAPTPRPAAPRPALTPEQLRQALAKADPQTRQKLMRLIAGGRTVQQVGAGASDGARKRSLVMQLDEDGSGARAGHGAPPGPVTAAPPTPARPAPPAPAASGFGPFTPAAAPARGDTPLPPTPAFARQGMPPRTARGVEPALMQIDEHTELLDAAPVGGSADPRKAGLQAQLDQARRDAAAPEPARGEPLAHKVLFPAYDPSRHGEDVHGATRRRHEGPIEGHFPAPRQPFQPHYRHPDGRPMTAEETKVEEVLQTQRCEETLSVLARDGVNGLLLSPRDLDAAVANGVLSAEAAATLWKTWAALRPVIHVIEDDPPAPAAAADEADETSDAVADAPPADGSAPPEPPAAMEGLLPDRTDEAVGRAAPPAAVVTQAAQATMDSSAAQKPAADPAAPTPARAAAITPPEPAPQRPDTEDPPRPRASVGPRPLAGPSVPDVSDPPTLPLPRATAPTQPHSEAPRSTPALATPNEQPHEPRAPWQTIPTTATAATAANPAAASTPGQRLRALARLVFWGFVAYCVLATSARLAMLAWLRWGHWFAA